MIEPTTTQPVRLGLGNLNGAGRANPIVSILSFIVLMVSSVPWYASSLDSCREYMRRSQFNGTVQAS